MALELHGITKIYGTLRANDDIDLTIEEGTLHGLLGENGAGKSTLMKVVSGFIAADSGEIRLHGRQLDLASPQDAIEAGIGMLHQDPLVFLPFTVLDNFLLGSRGATRLNRREGEAKLARMSGELGSPSYRGDWRGPSPSASASSSRSPDCSGWGPACSYSTSPQLGSRRISESSCSPPLSLLHI